MIITRTFDREVIRSIMAHPRVYPWISDDGSPHPDDYESTIHESLYFLLVEIDKPAAIFLYHPHNMITYEVHTCVLPGYYGKQAEEAAKGTLLWMIMNTSAKKIITHVPFNNIKAARFAERCGLSHEGVNRASFMKNGVIYDQYVLGITEAEICQQQQS